MKTILSKANFPEQELYLHKKNKADFPAEEYYINQED